MPRHYNQDPSETAAIYEMASKWASHLIDENSLLWPGQQIWSVENLKAFKKCFNDSPDESDDNFLIKFEKQLSTESPSVTMLACEILYVYLLFPSVASISGPVKVDLITKVASWQNIAITNLNLDVLLTTKGIGKTGTAYNTKRPTVIAYLAEFALAILEKPVDERKEILSNSNKLKDLLEIIQGTSKMQMRHILLHLLFPDEFEPIASTKSREIIYKVFKKEMPELNLPSDIDNALKVIRDDFEQKYPDKRISFYRDPIGSFWLKGNESPTNTVIKMVISWIQNLKTSISGDKRFYHKPMVVLALLARLDDEQEHENLFTYEELWSTFRELAGKLGGAVTEPQFSQPYVRLKNDVKPVAVWQMDLIDPNYKDEKSEQPAYVRTMIPHIQIHDDVWPVFQSEKGRQAIREEIKKKWDIETINIEQNQGNTSSIQHKTNISASSGTVNDKNVIQSFLESILEEYAKARQSEEFGKQSSLWNVFEKLKIAIIDSGILTEHIIVKWSMGQGNWAAVPWLALLDKRETTTTQKGVYIVLLFRSDMSGVYVTLNQGVTECKKQYGTKKGYEILRTNAVKICNKVTSVEISPDLLLDNHIDLRVTGGLGQDYENSTIAQKLYERGNVPPDTKILSDVADLLHIYDEYMQDKLSGEIAGTLSSTEKEGRYEMSFSMKSALETLLVNIASQGYVFEPWQIAAYVMAIKTKPFIILAGISGTGKSRLPQVIADLTGANIKVLPVRPDWTDSSDLLGYNDLQGNFKPGSFLCFVRDANQQPEEQFFCLIDEMNIARVEYYFAEVLSCIENRKMINKHYISPALLTHEPTSSMAMWASQGIPENYAIVGTVNMDESTHGFSRKVLDRAFTIEFSKVDLSMWQNKEITDQEIAHWPNEAWNPRAIRLPELLDVSDEEKRLIDSVVTTLIKINEILLPAQLQVGYRTRDELALFVLHAQEVLGSFRTTAGEQVDVLDIGLQMKILPRIVGSGSVIRQVLLNLLGWSYHKKALTEDEVDDIYKTWSAAGCPLFLPGAAYPGMTARLCLMWERLVNEGYTSFWL